MIQYFFEIIIPCILWYVQLNNVGHSDNWGFIVIETIVYHYTEVSISTITAVYYYNYPYCMCILVIHNIHNNPWSGIFDMYLVSQTPSLCCWYWRNYVYCFSKEKLPDVLVPPKVLELERERALKWGKMLRNWEKFQGSEIVSV